MIKILLFFFLTTSCLHAQVLLMNDLSKANGLIRDGKFNEAEEVLTNVEKQLGKANDETKAQALNAFGSLNLNKGRNDIALENLLQAQAIWEKLNKSQSLEAAQTQTLLGNLFRATGKYVQAEEQLNMALIIRKNKLTPNDESIAATYNDLGLVYTFSDLDKALTYYEMALSIYEKIHGKEDPKIAIAKTNIGYLYSRLELYGDAVTNFEESLTIWNKVYAGPHPSKAFVLYNLGQTYERMKNLENAKSYYQKAVAMYGDAYGEKHPDIARVNNSLGNISAAENDFDGAFNFYQKALQVNHPGFKSNDIYTNPSIQQYYDGNVLLYSLMFKAQALENSYFKKTLRFKELLNAIRTLESCDSLIDRLRQHISNESDKISLGAIANEVYADGVRISMETAVAALHKKQFLEKAFFFSEKSKAAVLLGSISDNNAKTFAGIPPALLEQEKQLKASIALCSQQLAQKPEAETEKLLRQTFYNLNRNYEIFIGSLEKGYPAYYNLKFNSSSPSIGELQRILPEGTMVLSYFVDEKSSRLYSFGVTADDFKIKEHQLTKDFDRNINAFRNSLLFSEIKTFKLASTYLSGQLIPRIKGSIKELVIIPAGRLSTIPFEALLASDSEKVDSFNALPFLITKYSVRYEFSTQLIVQKKIQSKEKNPSVLLCAPVNFSQNQGMPDLPGTEAEITDIQTLFDGRHLVNTVLLKKSASEKTLKEENLKRFTYLHFATHGVVDETNPELSKIFLNTDIKSEDGFLYAGEIYNLELNADLVTLSACETGLGKISKGEGVIGLSRALVYAGARNCIVSFWKVSDESTALLMKNYYQELLEKGDYNLGTTLQKVKIAMINDQRYASPFYWAPFILIGY
jgi:CHAT domain-containing protein